MCKPKPDQILEWRWHVSMILNLEKTLLETDTSWESQL